MNKILTLCLASSALLAHEYGFLGYPFVDPDRPIHLAGRYRQIGRADFRTHHRGHLNYADAYGALFYTHFLNEDNSLSWGVGYDYLKLGWERNPRFREKNFNYAVASLGYVSTAVEKWRWIVNGGFSVDANNFDFGPSAVYHGMLWGRYNIAECCRVHVGVLGWYGVKNGYALPIIGFDWKFWHDWTLAAIFPLDFSLNYAFNDHWSLEAAYSGFGGPYKYPRRAHEGINGFHDPIFMTYSRGADLNLRYKFDHLFQINLGAGWNWGGWIFVEDENKNHGKYYHFESAPYAQGTVAFTF
jgi:hypothetical protein